MTVGDNGAESPPWTDLRDSPPPPEPVEPTSRARADGALTGRVLAGRAIAGRAIASRAIAGRALAGRRLALTGQRPEPGPRRPEPGPFQPPEPGQVQTALPPDLSPAEPSAGLPAESAWPPAEPRHAPLVAEGRHAASPPGERRRGGWLVPFASGALTVLVLAAATVGTIAVLGHHAPRKKSAAARHTAAKAVPMPAQMPTATLFEALTQDIQAGNEADFLSQVAPAARPTVQTWWENLQAIGFTTGVVMPAASSDLVHVDSHGDATMTVLAGTHSPLDPLDGTGQPDIPSESYQVGLHFASASATGQITSWRPLGDAPWDQGVRLYVRKAANVVVAGLPGDSALVDKTLPMAEAAASYDIKLIDHVSPEDLHQPGFVVFVSGSSAVRDSWFSTSPQPPGWPPDFGGGLAVPLSGATGDKAVVLSSISTGITGGARVVITPYQDDGGTQHDETVQLVREFMTDILASDDETGTTSVPSWAIQGIGVAVQALYQQNGNPAPASYNFGPLTSMLHGLPSSHRSGQLPTSQQLFSGRVASEQDFSAVAGSVYAYIGIKYGVSQMLVAASLLYTRDSTPFGNITTVTKRGAATFYAPAAVEAAWRTWLAHT
jgi:hypothetical protein